ncbi:MAG TPA: class III extradiol ring-cleavage dioxygenase [Planctomycetota bacterium]|jgi:4,5-DOPA dioxygenase extradiol|nr:class III extradiol ring-cleavage dioxygenase [Planctomycetota bacterium]
MLPPPPKQESPEGSRRRAISKDGAPGNRTSAARGVEGKLSERTQLPAVFISHGSPMVLLDDDAYTRAIRRLGEAIPSPAAVLVVSAHWQRPLPIRVTGHPRPPLIYDFGGFPDELYEVSYPCPGSPELAAEIVSLLERGGFPAGTDASRGLDHGAWVPLRFAYPTAEVAVVEVSLPAGESPADLLRVGQALAPLRERGALLVGSGGIVHNLRRVAFDRKDAEVDPWARAFDDWVRDRLRAGDLESLISYRELAPHADLAVPTTEHFDPLFVVLGSGHEGERVIDLYEGFQYGNLSMRSFLRTG